MSASSGRPEKGKSRSSHGSSCLLFAGFLVVLGYFTLSPVNVRHSRENAAVQVSHQLGVAMVAYSNDNDGQYPDGKSSTEVFQKLLDGGYLSDPGILYIPLPGKTKADPGQKILKPENVCFDVTSGADRSSSDQLPLLFLTGYKVTYSPGSAAVPLMKPYPNYWERSWLDWFDSQGRFRPGIAVYYKGNNAVYKLLNPFGNSDNIVPNFVSPDFKPDGKTYRQLTPDGTLR